MIARVALVLPVLGLGCTFPDVATDGADSGATSSTTTTTAVTTGDPTTTTTSTGDATTSTSSTGGGGDGGSTSAGGGGAGGGDGGAGGGGGAPPLGDGFCPRGSLDLVGQDIAGCQFRTIEPAATGAGGSGGAAPEDGDCDGDGVPNGADACQPCDAAVPDDTYQITAYVRIDGTTSFDWDCSGTASKQYPAPDGVCPAAAFGLSCAYPTHYTASEACGETVGLVHCSYSFGCNQAGDEEQTQVACR